MLKSSHTFEAIGTHWEIVTERAFDATEKQALHELIDAFDSVYSRFRENSLVTSIAKKAGTYTFPENAQKLFGFYEELYALSSGKVTPLVGGMLEDLGYDAEYSFKAKEQVRAIPKYDDVVQREGVTITTSMPMVIDVGGAGKGYLVDLIAEWLTAHNYDEYIIDASGDILHKGAESEMVGLENPLQEGRVIGEVPLKNQALCGSANNRRKWGVGMHHILDPETGTPVTDIIATWALADSAIVADGIATSLFFTDPKVLRKQYNYEYVRVHADGAVEYSEYFATLLY